jgi:hypothetical protein
MPVKPPVIKTTDVFMDHSSCFSLSDTQGMAGETGKSQPRISPLDRVMRQSPLGAPVPIGRHGETMRTTTGHLWPGVPI